MQIPNCFVLLMQGGKVLFWSWVPYALLPEILVDCGRRKTSTPHPQFQQAGHWQCCDCLGRVHQEIVAFCFPKRGSCLNWSYKIVTGGWLSGLCVYKCRETLAHLSFHISPCSDNTLCKGRKRHMRFIDWDHKWISRSSSYPGQAYMPFVIDSAHFIEVPFPKQSWRPISWARNLCTYLVFAGLWKVLSSYLPCIRKIPKVAGFCFQALASLAQDEA